MDYQEYLKSEGWKAKRNMILNMWGNRCALCNEGGELHLHHRTYERKGNEDPYDLIPLCKTHHKMFHEQPSSSPKTERTNTKIEDIIQKMEKFTKLQREKSQDV